MQEDSEGWIYPIKSDLFTLEWQQCNRQSKDRNSTGTDNVREIDPFLTHEKQLRVTNSFCSLLSVETRPWIEVWNLPTQEAVLSIWLPFYNPSYIGQFYRFCLQIVWQLSRQRMSGGVLGSPESFFVAHGQARIKRAVANVQCKKQPQPPKAIR